MFHPKKYIAALLLCCIQTAAAAELDITISDIRTGSGKVYVTVFSSAESFDTLAEKKGEFFALMVLPARKGKVSAVIKSLPDGEYSLVAFHDENNNAELDTTLVGLPAEALGFSNNIPLNDYPTFVNTGVSLSGDVPLTQTIQLINP